MSHTNGESIETRASKSGINADQEKKQDAKYESMNSKEDEAKAKFWMEAVTGEPINGDMFAFLRDGTYLCKVLNKLQDGLVEKKFEKPATGRFKQLETIGKFLAGCCEYGMKQDDLFTSLDLYEERDKNMVLSGIIALGRTAQKNGFEGPMLGPKEAEPNVRDFPPEVIQEGNKTTSLQYGTNKLASSTGMTAYGTQRQILDPAL